MAVFSQVGRIDSERAWDANNPELNRIFCAALTGIIASNAFHGAIYQQSPNAAVEFADSVVLAATTPPKGSNHE